MRRTYQAPLSASISRSIGSRVCNTFLASLRSAPSGANELRSISGRPISSGITLKRSLVAGVKNRIFSLASRRIVATSVLHKTFCRSLAVKRPAAQMSPASLTFESCPAARSRAIVCADGTEFGRHARSDDKYFRGRIATPHFFDLIYALLYDAVRFDLR